MKEQRLLMYILEIYLKTQNNNSNVCNKLLHQMLSFYFHKFSHYLPLLAQVSCFTEPCHWSSSSLPQTQSTVVLIKLCAALLTSSPMVILGHIQCEGCCKHPHEPIGASIRPYGAFMHSFFSITHLCLNIGLEFDCEICPAIADLDHTSCVTKVKLLRWSIWHQHSQQVQLGEKSCQRDLSLSPWLWHGLP